MTPPPQAEAGGLANAIFGSLRDGGAGDASSARRSASWPASTSPNTARRAGSAASTRFINDILLSAPSIVIGLFIYAVVVARTARPSRAGPASLALALIVIPVVIRTTENMLQLVPNALREAAYALGTPKWKVIMTRHAERGARRRGHRRPAGAWRASPARPRRCCSPRCRNQFWTTDLSAADGEPAGDDLQVRDEPVRELAEAGLGRRVPDHARRCWR